MYHDGIEFSDPGPDRHYVSINLPPRKEVIAEVGALLAKDNAIDMRTVPGDGSPYDSSALNKLLSAGKRMMAGEKPFVTKFRNNTYDKPQTLSFTVPFPGTILPFDLNNHKGEIVAQKGAFLFGTPGTRLTIYLQKKIMSGLFSGEGFILQRLAGRGNKVFIHVGGQAVERELADGETIQVDTGTLAAMESSVSLEVKEVKGVSNMLFGGMGIFHLHLTGPGKVWLQTLPFPRLAEQVWHAIPESEKNKFAKQVEKKIETKKGFF